MPGTGATECVPCPETTYAEFSGTLNCAACDPNTLAGTCAGSSFGDCEATYTRDDDACTTCDVEHCFEAVVVEAAVELEDADAALWTATEDEAFKLALVGYLNDVELSRDVEVTAVTAVTDGSRRRRLATGTVRVEFTLMAVVATGGAAARATVFASLVVDLSAASASGAAFVADMKYHAQQAGSTVLDGLVGSNPWVLPDTYGVSTFEVVTPAPTPAPTISLMPTISPQPTAVPTPVPTPVPSPVRV